MPTPYVTPNLLIAAPTGISWGTIPDRGSTAGEKLAEQTNICWRATDQVDSWCNQALRATVNTEELEGPDYRLTVRSNGNVRFLSSRWPVLSILGGQVSGAASFPPNWIVIPPDQLRVIHPFLGSLGSDTFSGSGTGPSAIEIAPGYVDWRRGRNGYRVEVFYTNGWPHTSLTADCNATSASAQVDDVTGWAGSEGQFFDGANTEFVTVSSVVSSQSVTMPDGTTVPVGPGTIHFATNTGFNHPKGALFTAMPQIVQWATIWFAIAEALTRGTASTTVQSMPGSSVGGGAVGSKQANEEGQRLLKPFRRII